MGRGPLLPSRATPDGEPDGLIFGPSGLACAGITAVSAITAARTNLKARNLSLLEWTVFDVYATTGHRRRFVPSSRAYSQVILARCGQLEPYLLLSFLGRSGRSPRWGLVLMWPIAMSHPMVMVVMATLRSQKAAPITSISAKNSPYGVLLPHRCGGIMLSSILLLLAFY